MALFFSVPMLRVLYKKKTPKKLHKLIIRQQDNGKTSQINLENLQNLVSRISNNAE